MKSSYKLIGFALSLACASLGQDVPKADLFFGYSALRIYPAQAISHFTAEGGIATFGFNFNNHIGLEAEFGGYHNGDIRNSQLDTDGFSFLFGPRVSVGRSRRFDPYFHVLFGGMRFSTNIASSSFLIGTPQGGVIVSSNSYSTSQVNFAMAAGFGLDIKLGRRVVLRPIQLDYFLTRFEEPSVLDPSGVTSNRNQNNARYAGGIAFNFGGERPSPPPPPPPPPPPKMKTCPDGTSVTIDRECPKQNIGLNIRPERAEVCPGETSRVAPTSTLPAGAVAHWSINGESTSEAPVLSFGSTGRNPGVYQVGVKVTAEGYNDASAETTVRVRDYVPPTGTVQASPAEIWAGEKAALSARFAEGQCGGPVRETTFSASEGSISGQEYDSATVRFDPPGASEQRKSVTITAKGTDSRGSGTAETTLVVKQKAAISARRLPDIIFPAKNDRVNNCGKRVLLEELKTLFENDPGGTVVFVGHLAANESGATSLDLKRALNAAAVISAGEGICARFPASRIQVKGAGAADNGVDFQPYFCGTSTDAAERRGQAVDRNDDQTKFRRVEVWFVPTGGTLPASAKDAKDAATLGVGNLGCPR